MKIFRNVLWALIFVFAGMLGWLVFEWSRSDAGGANAAYGVPFELTDHRGQPITQAALRDRPSALFFGFTHCPEVCPTTLYELDGWLQQADPQGRIGAYFVTVDPERDTPEMMDAYVSAVSDRITGISGTPEEIARMVKGFHVYARKVPLDTDDPDGDYTMDHTASVFLLDRDGRFKSTIAWGEDAAVAVKKLENLLKD
ncbi:SCO family protein [Pseudohoeflea coraliihabitans]|uniref:SCO family protein n=1 Tax=Pseudohoeflea coraliihabitans TaxID=2860393 RepID=A0ABS6WIY5_9HYPH|nr:SCO family protein [Pseudohoeflea sp. DP4N28-3]MBW3095901.1 SCO family protein [Pseudohoeflea sp. DP4N28-3]